MIKSMTGYACLDFYFQNLSISMSIKSVNSRYLDCCIKLGNKNLFLEPYLRSIVKKYISRGRVDVSVSVDDSLEWKNVASFNDSCAEAFLRDLRHFCTINFMDEEKISISDILKHPDVFKRPDKKIDSDVFISEMCGKFENLVQQLVDCRETEGISLKEDILQNINNLKALHHELEILYPKIIDNYEINLKNKFSEILGDSNLSEELIMVEVGILADKVAINEELVRLNSHLSMLENLLESNKPVGKKLDFTIQETNREINTISSKLNGAGTGVHNAAALVVEAKSELEKIREQVQNIE